MSKWDVRGLGDGKLWRAGTAHVEVFAWEAAGRGIVSRVLVQMYGRKTINASGDEEKQK